MDELVFVGDSVYCQKSVGEARRLAGKLGYPIRVIGSGDMCPEDVRPGELIARCNGGTVVATAMLFTIS